MTTKEIIKAEQGEKALTGFADNKGLEFLQEAMATEYAGMEFQLDRLKFPSAGATVFEVADDEEPATGTVGRRQGHGRTG